MIRQHARNSRRAIGGLIIYTLAFVYCVITIFRKTNINATLKIIIIIGGITLGIVVYLIEVFNGIFNTVIICNEGIEIKNIRCNKIIYWYEVTSIRLLCEKYDVRYGLNERYYGIYFQKNNVECKEMISYSKKVDAEIRKYYKKENRK